jgi:anaplastic lymphoma kinase
LLVAGGGGGLGVGRFLDENVQQAKGIVVERSDVSGIIEMDSIDNKLAGPGGGWRARPDSALGTR